jgi:DNA-binding response OmpR family regulator
VLRVLVIAEGADAADLARQAAAAGCAVVLTDGGPGAVEVARRVGPDVVVLGAAHLSFPGRLRELRPDRYPLFLSASTDTQSLLRGLKNAAPDL